MNDSSIDDTILDSDVDTSCVSNGEGEVDPSGLLGLGGVESPLVAALDEVIESNNTDTDLLVDVEGGGKHLDPKDPQPEAEAVSLESVGPEGQGPEEFLGTSSIPHALLEHCLF